jgi:palmitoyltransferase
MAALTQHVESPSVRCNIRNTDGYDDFLDKLTAGIVDRAGSNPDGMPKLTVSEGARTAFVERSEEKQEDKGWDDECEPSW